MNQVNERIEKLKDGLLSKEEALEKAAPFEGCQEVFISGQTGFMFSPNKDDEYVMTHGSKEYAFGNEGIEKISRLVGIPATYVEKVPKDLLFPHLSYWLNNGEVAVKAFVRTDKSDDGGRPIIMGFANRDAFYYPLSRFLAQVDKVQPEYLVEGFEDITWRNSCFGLVFPQAEFMVETPTSEIQKGDHLYGGIKFHGSMLGESAMKISAFFLTLVCLNGMVSVDEVYTYNRRFGMDGVDGWITDGINCAYGALNAEVDKVRRLTSIEIGPATIVPYINHMFDQRNIPVAIRKSVLETIVSKNPRNLYELMNAITATAHTLEKRNEVYSLQALGGYVASHAESCQVCHRPLDKTAGDTAHA